MPNKSCLWQDWVYQCYLLFGDVNEGKKGTFKGSWHQAVVLRARLALPFCFFLQVLNIFPFAWQLQSPLVKPRVAVPFLSLPSTSGLPAASPTEASMHTSSLWRSMCLCFFVVIPEPLLHLWEPPLLRAALLEPCKEAQGVWISSDYSSCSQEKDSSFWNTWVFGLCRDFVFLNWYPHHKAASHKNPSRIPLPFRKRNSTFQLWPGEI